jgi:uncharacterized LabA/DUF88 family protein
MPENTINISQNVAVLVDGNNIELSIKTVAKNQNALINFDKLIPRLVDKRSLTRLTYFREGSTISSKLADRIHEQFYGTVRPCLKSADIPLTIEAVQLSEKVDTIIILSGDADYIELVKYLKQRGVRVEIASVYHSTSQNLKKEADRYHAITAADWFILNPKNYGEKTSLQ